MSPNPGNAPNLPLDVVADRAPIAIGIFGPDLRLGYLNAHAQRLFQLPANLSSPIGVPLPELSTTAPILNHFVGHCQEVLRTGSPVTTELEVPTAAGQGWYQVTFVPVLGDTRTPQAVASIATDVTALKLAQQQLHARYQRIQRTARAVAWEFDYETGEVVMGPEGLTELGLPTTFSPNTLVEGLVGFHPEDRDMMQTVVAGILTGKLPSYEVEFRATDASGVLHWFGLHAQVEYAPNGERLRANGVLCDITPRKKAEQALIASELRFRHFFNHCPAAAWIKSQDGRFEHVNPQWERLIGQSSAEVLGKTDAEIFPAESAEVFRHHDQQVLRTGAPHTVVESTHMANGEQRPWLTTRFLGEQWLGGFALDTSEQQRLHDERLQLERQMLQAQKLESLGVLAGGIAHDFNNLLTSMLGYASLARTEKKLSADMDHYLGQIEVAACRAADLCKQMLAYAGRGQFEVRPIDLNLLVNEMSNLLATAVSKRAVFKFNLTTPLPPVQADPTQIRQVVMNLITNASDAIAEKSGVITLSTGLIDADAQYLADIGVPHLPPQRYAYLEVSDTGCGMTEAVQGKIFEPFFTTKFTGRGLGLAAVQGIIRAHNGGIKIYSQPGKGTTFKVLLPARNPEDASEIVPSPLITPIGRDRWVLVVDDEEDVRVLVRKTLQLHGFQVETANDGRAGVECFREQPERYSVVLLDLTMPRMSGTEAFRQMRLLRPDVCVLLTSGYAAEDATTGFEGKGLAGFLRKPFRIQELLAAILTAIGT